VPNEYFPDSITNGRESQIGLSAMAGIALRFENPYGIKAILRFKSLNRLGRFQAHPSEEPADENRSGR
jgi:hypothetical protein